MAVLDQDRALRKAQECAPRVLELRRPDEHRTVDVVSPPGVRVDRGAAVDEGVEEGQRSVKPKTLRADLQHEERRVARSLDVECDE
ncbi:MAG TPA: hypothetical protein VJP81_00910, partial [Candidatus Dormibacteraeota bacterium]|nr:hypothetical protein [Candidatus Dormibacteraeota bacterium]